MDAPREALGERTLRLDELRIWDRLDQRPQPDVSVMPLFTEVSERMPSLCQQKQTATWSEIDHGLSSRKLPSLSWHEWRDIHPACASSTATMHVAVALSLDEYIHIYTRQRKFIDRYHPPTDTTGRAQKQTLSTDSKGIMSTQIQQDVARNNEQYAASFTSGHLALPPARKYLVGMH
jgi:hypothetical protein